MPRRGVALDPRRRGRIPAGAARGARATLEQAGGHKGVDPLGSHARAKGFERIVGARSERQLPREPTEFASGRAWHSTARGLRHGAAQRMAAAKRVGKRDRHSGGARIDCAAMPIPPSPQGLQDDPWRGSAEHEPHDRAHENRARHEPGDHGDREQPPALDDSRIATLPPNARDGLRQSRHQPGRAGRQRAPDAQRELGQTRGSRSAANERERLGHATACNRRISSPSSGARSPPPSVYSSRAPAASPSRTTSATDSTRLLPSGARAWCTTS